MLEEMKIDENNKFYSAKAIGIASYFGGPIAASILIRKNFFNLNKEREGNITLLIGIISTILLFIGIFSIPESILDKIPNILIPLIYTGIILLIVKETQGNDLILQKENDGEFYSNWYAVGIGLICTLIIFIGIFGFSYLETDNWDENDIKKYDTGIEKYQNNEKKAEQLFENISNKSNVEIMDFIDDVGTPKWNENVKIIENLTQIENLPIELQNQNIKLKEYCELKIKQYDLIKMTVLSNSKDYELELTKINERLKSILDDF